MSARDHGTPMPAVSAILSRYDRETLAAFITVAIDLMDAADGDPDIEPNGDEDDDPGDLRDSGWPEWHTRGKSKEAFMSASRQSFVGWDGRTIRADLHEDTEIDDPAEEDDAPEEDGEDRCLAGDDGVFSGSALPVTYSRLISGAGDEDDAEVCQATDNVPAPTVFTLEYDLFRDERTVIGISNLLTSYRTNGRDIRSADTGRIHRSTGHDRKPGAPV
ncbi:hypothetical protein Sphch_3153 [Sphingobium chlorophenolicum L-1]|uniref:Uncharacterized protein n=1 Tax=Sphingobium chlorophenolicum L-1 TaxID=690566 RepID=F6F2V6_SPHCR|nr:hypothetical protein [Sphingobium chlorophenolicum]AEG50768.1 hypothetical protein Sphch_3153 [Sphingobium chlorophenolicum L-1]